MPSQAEIPRPLDSLKLTLDTYRFTPSPRNSPRKRAIEKNYERDILPSLEVVTSRVVIRAMKLETEDSFPRLPPAGDLETPQPSKKRTRTTSTRASERTQSPKKRKRGFAPPEQYAHLNYLQDILKEDLDIMFCGINPGCMSAEIGHHFANPTNHFWKCLHRSGLTDCLVPASEDFTIAARFNIGLTNLVDRLSAEQAELSNEDMISGVPALLMKIARLRPYVVCFVGKGIWEIFRKEISKLVNTVSPNSEAAAVAGSEPTSSSSTPKSSEIIAKEKDPEYENEAQLVGAAKKASIKKTTESKKSKRSVTQKLVFSWGIQPYKTVHSCRGTAVRETLFFVVPSTSGRVVSHQLSDKVKLFEALKERLDAFKEGRIPSKDMLCIPLPDIEEKRQ